VLALAPRALMQSAYLAHERLSLRFSQALVDKPHT